MNFTANPDADIKNFDSLDDIDPMELMIYVRNQFLTAAKDLTVKTKHQDDKAFGEVCCNIAEKLQEAIDIFDYIPND